MSSIFPPVDLRKMRLDPTGLGANRRRAKRHRLSLPATLIADRHPVEKIRATVVEISVGGIALGCQRPLNAGDIYQIDAFDPLIPIGTKIQIVSSRPAKGGFVIGTRVV